MYLCFLGAFRVCSERRKRRLCLRKNETGKGCLPGGKTHFCPQRLKSAPLTTVTKVGIAGFMVYKTIAFSYKISSEIESFIKITVMAKLCVR